MKKSGPRCTLWSYSAQVIHRTIKHVITFAGRLTEVFDSSQLALASLSQSRPPLGSLQCTAMAMIQENQEDPSFVSDTEGKVKKLTDYYTNTEDKIKERINQVRMALFRCQDYEEALAGMERWLSEAEDKLSSLGPLSIRPAAIQRQRVLLMVRKPARMCVLCCCARVCSRSRESARVCVLCCCVRVHVPVDARASQRMHELRELARVCLLSGCARPFAALP